MLEMTGKQCAVNASWRSPMRVKFRGQMLSMPDIPFVDSSKHSSRTLIISEHTLLPTVPG